MMGLRLRLRSVHPDKRQNLLLGVLEERECFLDLVLGCLEGWEVLQVRAFLFDFLPELLDGVVVGGGGKKAAQRRSGGSCAARRGLSSLHSDDTGLHPE
jgi:hypothetical protein